MCVFRTNRETTMEHIDALEAVRRLTLERDALAERVEHLKSDMEKKQEFVNRVCNERDALANELDAVKDDFRVSRQTLDSIRAATGLYNYGPHLAESLKAMKEDRDALAEQVRRLEADAEKQNTSPPASSPRPCPECGKEVTVSWHPCGALFWCDCVACWYHGPTADEPFAAITAHDLFFDRLAKWRDAPQAPERHEHHETGTEPTEGTNGAPRGCGRACWTCETCRHWKDNRRTGYMPVGHCHAHPPTQDPEEAEHRAIFPLLWAGDCCGEWQPAPNVVV